VEGIAAPAQTQTPVQYLDLRLNAGAQIGLPVPTSHIGFVMVLEGDPKVGAERALGLPVTTFVARISAGLVATIRE
jgi:redox-sensitive bicupin YhaK (pirin superfamily)